MARWRHRSLRRVKSSEVRSEAFASAKQIAASAIQPHPGMYFTGNRLSSLLALLAPKIQPALFLLDRAEKINRARAREQLGLRQIAFGTPD